MRRLLPLLTACAACLPPASTDLTADTDVAHTDVADSDTPVDDGAVYQHAIVHLRILPADHGLDLDGDGLEDNALGSAAQSLTSALDDALQNGGRAITLQVAGAANLVDDEVDVGLFTGTPVSKDGGPNGEPVVDGGSAVDDRGRARLSTRARLASGTYRVTLANDALTIGELTFHLTHGLHVVAQVTPAAQAGTLGFAADASRLSTLLRDAGQGALADSVDTLADIDSDLDGSPDAVSLAMDFSATAVVLRTAP